MAENGARESECEEYDGYGCAEASRPECWRVNRRAAERDMVMVKKQEAELALSGQIA